MDEALSRLTVVVDGGPESDAREVSELAGQLRRRLLELDVHGVELVRDNEVPEGAKPVDAVTVGALTIALTPTLVTAVVDLVKSWISGRPVRGAKLTIDGDSIELTNATEADQERLTRAFIERHAKE